MQKKIVIANWKMNPVSYREAAKLASDVLKFANKTRNADIVLSPPFMWLTGFSRKDSKSIKWGAQDVFWENPPGGGPFTGEISPTMLKNSGVRYVIVGHSERRKWFHETDEMIGKKFKAVLAAGLAPILCVGEPIEVRRRGIAATLRYVRNQIRRAAVLVPKNLLGKQVIVAYEPIWAIGTGLPCEPAEAERMVRACTAYLSIKENFVNIKGIYGGSVNGENSGSYLHCEYIDGLLVGGASLKAEEFKTIVEKASYGYQ